MISFTHLEGTMAAEITLTGNAGVRVVAGSAGIFVDAFYGGAIPGVAGSPAILADDIAEADIILVTHDHWDHFEAKDVAGVAVRTGAKVIGPRPVARQLDGLLPPGQVIELEPPLARAGGSAKSESLNLPQARITAFRTFHARHHNSYLVETPEFRFFHDGDNEDTRRVDAGALKRLDALFIGPWQGSGWAKFIEKTMPGCYVLVHLSDEELEELDAGSFLPGICDRVPPGLVKLRPGQPYASK